MSQGGMQGVAGARRSARLTQLGEMLRQGGPARLESAAAALGVSSMTLRRDLAKPGQPFTLLGGHVVPVGGPSGASPYALEREQDSHTAAKRQAARHAAALVEDGDTIFIDCGTTMPHFVEALPAGLSLTVLCYALNIVTLLSRRARTQLVLLGGLYHPASATFASDEALASLRRVRINKAFVSAGGVHATRGVTCTNFNEVPVKQVALASAAQSFLVVDSSKLGKLKPAYFAPVTAFERIVTSALNRTEPAAALARAGARLDAAGAGS
ncbi:DeoR/GlpR family DNA-binding transcription regulator [Pseudoroseomonas ludipueritiae]|uniref:DeoR/GlpR transcriptional regulator n=1 Tax=Pseudoroseomonas ludipueritiae TaxID=198093 RepID=A0ABR7R245_9PROT|nr:DeoR/GlpR family DNA-binding transcription regulator [Pseudoroseomonas ludipueritiae]MBC9175820.1 DeoR/GlpR transcriptional regulator [Pseudoroseomonas ludipueritiae]MCG7361057.1 DeoR/GlpR family DNA-binding transcription regulator [Roseomonas sp. ACRSG]